MNNKKQKFQILKKEELISIKGGLTKEEKALKLDDIRCRQELKKSTNGDGLW